MLENIKNVFYFLEETEEAAALRRRRQELPTERDIGIRNIGYLLDAQRVSAEVLTNLCSADDEGMLSQRLCLKCFQIKMFDYSHRMVRC